MLRIFPNSSKYFHTIPQMLIFLGLLICLAINSNLKIITSMKAFLGVLIAVILGVVLVDQLRKAMPSL